MERSLTVEEKRSLLRLARKTLEARFKNEPLPELEPPDGPLTEIRGAFVTLKKDGQLRGCIGHVAGVEPLWESVRSNTINAALNDPRFNPLSPDELPTVHIEISALTPLKEVSSPDEVKVGTHGIMIEHGLSRGLLLPQVATEYGWDRETFLDYTCRKAGLSPGCWKDPMTRIMVFSAEVFSEDSVPDV
jgi:AmmeMemoRadiSam system protein A